MSTSAAVIIDGPFGNHDTVIPAEPFLHLRKNPFLEEAREVCNDILDKQDIMNVGSSADDLMAYGVGSMIAKLYSKGALEDTDEAFRQLSKVFPRARLQGEKALRFNRRTVFDALQALGLVPMSLSIAEAKPAGTLPNIAEIARIVENHTHITLAQIKSSARSRDIVKARFMAIWVMRHVCGKSLTYIGEQMGNRDHTSVLNGVNRMMTLRRTDIAARYLIDDICDEADLLALRRHHGILVTQTSRRS